jgi:hypothetical protein
MTRRLPTKQLLRLGGRAIHVLKYLEKVVHPRWPMTFEVAKRAVGIMVLCRGRWIGALCCPSCRDYMDRPWVSSSLGNNCRRGPYQRLAVIGRTTTPSAAAYAPALAIPPRPALAYRRRLL